MNLTLFDLDGTLLPIDSDHSFGDYLIEIGWADGGEWKSRNDEFYEQYLAGRLDQVAYIDFATSAWRHRPLQEALAVRQRFMDERLGPQLLPPARALVAQHQAAGDLVAIVTATNDFVTAPIAAAFGVEHLIATRLARDAAGRYTGQMDGVPCLQQGKVVRVGEWLAQRGAQWQDFERITVYSDSINDLPLMERATHPVATNPGESLAAVARERAWPILQLFP